MKGRGASFLGQAGGSVMVVLLCGAAHAQALPEPTRSNGVVGDRAPVTFLAVVPPCEARDVVIFNEMPSKVGTMRTVACRRDYAEPVEQVLERYRRNFETAGYTVRMGRRDGRLAHLNAMRRSSNIEVFLQRNDAGLVEVVHELRP